MDSNQNNNIQNNNINNNIQKKKLRSARKKSPNPNKENENSEEFKKPRRSDRKTLQINSNSIKEEENVEPSSVDSLKLNNNSNVDSIYSICSPNNILVVDKNGGVSNKFLRKKKQREIVIDKPLLHPIIRKAYQNRLKEFNSKILLENSIPIPSKTSIPKCFTEYTQIKYFKMQEKRISLTLIKSNIGQSSMINKKFLISSAGLEGTLKRDKRPFISIGRQQVNESGERPNDIMMFPTDPSISRTHCKLFYQEYYETLKNRDSQFTSIFMMTHPRLGKISPGKHLGSELVASIYSFLNTTPKLILSDNGTIFGTYIKTRQFDILKHLKYIFKTNLTEVFDYINKTFFNEYLTNILAIREKDFYDYLRNLLMNEISASYSAHNQLMVKIQILINGLFGNKPVDKHFFLENNNLLSNKSVYLFDMKAGMIILSIGGVENVIQSLLDESSLFDNHVNHLNPIEIISLDKLNDDQTSYKYSNCTFYKVRKSRSELTEMLLQSNTDLDNSYSIIHIIFTHGDPCGIMNRGQEILLFAKKFKDTNYSNSEFFFLSDSNIRDKGHYDIASIGSIKIFYQPIYDKWAINDLSNLSIYNSYDYFGLYKCISEDKKSNSRFESNHCDLKCGDEFRLSESVFKVDIEEPESL